MKREIKFRALSMCKGERWVCGDLRHYARNPHTEKWTIHDPSTGLETDIDETTIGQFTGLYDKNDVEIYEGDVVKTQFNKVPLGWVIWHEDGYFCICTSKERYEYRESFTPIGNLMYHHINGKKIEIEVIGNIHDNKDLL